MELLKLIAVTLTSIGLALAFLKFFYDKKKDNGALVLIPVAIQYDKNRGIWLEREEGFSDRYERFTLGIKIVNGKGVALKVDEVGFKLNSKSRHDKVQVTKYQILGEECKLPVIVEGFDNKVIAFEPIIVSKISRSQIESIYVKTACNREFLGKGRVLDDYLGGMVKLAYT